MMFTLLDDELANAKEDSVVKSNPGGAAALAQVPSELEDAVTDTAEEYPGECIFIEGQVADEMVTFCMD